MKKYVGYMVAFVFGTYLWFVLLPMWFNYSFPTGGWDWLGFVGVVGGLFLSVWCLKKQQELSVVPCLDVDAYSTLDNNAQNKVFRIFNDTDGRIYNDGYIILRTPGKTEPDGFRKSANIKVTNKGLSTAFQVCVYLYDLKSVKGLASLDEIATTPIDDFYDKIDYKGYTYYEETDVDAEPVKSESGWLISPQYNLCANAGEFNLVFDFSKVTQKYHSTAYDRYPWEYNTFILGGDVILIESDLLADALNALPQENRDILLMYWFLEMADREIAERMNLARRTINNRRLKSYRLLKELMGGDTDA